MYAKKQDPKPGDRFGKLVVLNELEYSSDSSKHLFKVLCDCGIEKVVSKFELCSSKIKSCGCLRKENIKKFHETKLFSSLAKEGDKFGRLTIIRFITKSCKKTDIVVECECDCGVVKNYSYNSLITGKSLSCGCLQKERTSCARKKEIPIGSRFGRLVVIKEQRLECDPKRLSYLCQCDCGKTKVIRAKSLLDGQTTSCGCFAIEKRRESQNRKATLTDPKPGDRFGMITVLEMLPIGQKDFNNGDRSVRCICECGNEFVTRKQCLLNGQKSCGCNKISILLSSHIDAAKELRIYPDGMRDYIYYDSDRLLFDRKELSGNSIVTFKCKKCGNPFKIELVRMCYFKTGELIRDYVCSCCLGGVSFQEESVYNFILSLGVIESDVIRHNRTIMNNKQELDFYIPNKKVAIEYNGSFWHSEKNGKQKYYHKQKHELCLKNNISLLNIFDFHWLNNKNIIQDIISKRLNIGQNLFILNECSVLEISKEKVKTFYCLNSMEQFDDSINYTAFSEKETILCCIGYLIKDKTFLLKNICFCIGFMDINYVSNIIKYIKHNYSDINRIEITLNNDIDDNLSFLKNGFHIEKDLEPLCYYVYNNNIISVNDVNISRILDEYPSLKNELENSCAYDKKEFLLTKLGVNKVYNSGYTLMSLEI